MAYSNWTPGIWSLTAHINYNYTMEIQKWHHNCIPEIWGFRGVRNPIVITGVSVSQAWIIELKLYFCVDIGQTLWDKIMNTDREFIRQLRNGSNIPESKASVFRLHCRCPNHEQHEDISAVFSQDEVINRTWRLPPLICSFIMTVLINHSQNCLSQ